MARCARPGRNPSPPPTGRARDPAAGRGPRPPAGEAPPAEPPPPGHPSNTPARREPAQPAAEVCPSAAGLDRIALPYSQPDWQALDGSLPSGRSLRLRLHIDALGRVRRIDAVEAAAEDSDLLPRLRSLLSATRYVPARQAGQDVASCLDLSIEATQAE
ncbi:MAG TPA: hypothetical protein PLW24_05585 [Burkholderiaceae bacterium]|nr:hypothetical protein [Burkholderiaceae bacterium]HNG78919.1 hypothetical protein [Burkholderiaceae bacterium]